MSGRRNEEVGRLVVICSLPGSGKTTLAKQLEVDYDAVRLSRMSGCTYRVFDPSPQGDGQKPLVLVVHGGMEQGSAMVERTQFDTLAQARNIIVAHQDGAQGHWNSGSCCGMTGPPKTHEVIHRFDRRLVVRSRAWQATWQCSLARKQPAPTSLSCHHDGKDDRRRDGS